METLTRRETCPPHYHWASHDKRPNSYIFVCKENEGDMAHCPGMCEAALHSLGEGPFHDVTGCSVGTGRVSTGQVVPLGYQTSTNHCVTMESKQLRIPFHVSLTRLCAHSALPQGAPELGSPTAPRDLVGGSRGDSGLPGVLLGFPP